MSDCKSIHITQEQKVQLGKLWFIFGNHGACHSHSNHRFIQVLLEENQDCRNFFKPDATCLQNVDNILSSQNGQQHDFSHRDLSSNASDYVKGLHKDASRFLPKVSYYVNLVTPDLAEIIADKGMQYFRENTIKQCKDRTYAFVQSSLEEDMQGIDAKSMMRFVDWALPWDIRINQFGGDPKGCWIRCELQSGAETEYHKLKKNYQKKGLYFYGWVYDKKRDTDMYDWIIYDPTKLVTTGLIEKAPQRQITVDKGLSYGGLIYVSELRDRGCVVYEKSWLNGGPPPQELELF